MTTPPDGLDHGADHALSQPLARGLAALRLIAASPEPVALGEIAAHLDVQQSVASRLVRTLERDGLVVRRPSGYRAAAGLVDLGRQAAQPAHPRVTAVLTALVEDLGMTAFAVERDEDEWVAVGAVEARHAGPSLVQHPGARYPIRTGAPGIALLAALGDTLTARELADLAGPRLDDVRAARGRGWTSSEDEASRCVRSVAVPVRSTMGRPMALGVVYLRAVTADDAAIAARLAAGAARLAALT